MLYAFPHVLPCGDAALLVEFGDEISAAASGRVRTLDADLTAAPIPGIIETIPAYCSLLVEYDPLLLTYADLKQNLVERLERANEWLPPAAQLKRVPTVYGGEFGPDLEEVAAAHGLTPDQVISIHSGTVYTVYMLGFSPGFAYMGQVPESIATPRLPAPRTRVPAGSVAIAARQTGVYPQSTPGGWRILGRTGLALFDPGREPACFFQPGDQVQFVSVHSEELATPLAPRPLVATGDRSIEVLAPGLLTTVQDLGRSGSQRFGVPVSGAMDAFALRAANVLVGNAFSAGALEMTVVGPVLRFRRDALVAVTGADLSLTLHAPNRDRWAMPLWTAVYVRGGSLLEFGSRRSGCRAYLAVAGGIVTPVVMRSASTYLPGGFGGYEGRSLREGDALPVGPALGHFPTLAGRSISPEHQPDYGQHPTVRVVLGPQDDYFTPEAIQTFLSRDYEVSTSSDRMGLRLVGPSLMHRGKSEIISNGVALGAVQVPPNGQPIVLTADRQTVGGYPVIATVIRADIPLLAQCLPGESRLRFQAVTVEEAQSLHRAQSRRHQPESAAPDAINF